MYNFLVELGTYWLGFIPYCRDQISMNRLLWHQLLHLIYAPQHTWETNITKGALMSLSQSQLKNNRSRIQIILKLQIGLIHNLPGYRNFLQKLTFHKILIPKLKGSRWDQDVILTRKQRFQVLCPVMFVNPNLFQQCGILAIGTCRIIINIWQLHIGKYFSISFRHFFSVYNLRTKFYIHLYTGPVPILPEILPFKFPLI